MRKDELEIDRVYKRSAKVYRQRRVAHQSIHNTFIVNPAIRELLQDVQGVELLDIGCGFGEDLKYFASKGARVTGIELNADMVAMAKKDPELKNVMILQGSIYALRVKKTFDVCLANLVLDQVQDLSRAMKEVSRVLKPGGRFVFSMAHPINCATDNYQNPLADYFSEKKGFFTPSSFSTKIPYYFRNIEQLSRVMEETGFWIKALREPRPLKEAERLFKDDYKKYSKLPDVFVVEAVKR